LERRAQSCKLAGSCVRRDRLRARRRSSGNNAQHGGGVPSGRGCCRRWRIASPQSLSGALRALSLVVRRRGGGSRSSARAATSSAGFAQLCAAL
jgi:hypothetical protein